MIVMVWVLGQREWTEVQASASLVHLAHPLAAVVVVVVDDDDDDDESAAVH